jgi:hypothetical protein
VFFWKVVYYVENTQLKRAAFMMGQMQGLLDLSISLPNPSNRLITEQLNSHRSEYFSDYEDAALFQVEVEFVEAVTKLAFHPAAEDFQDPRASKLIWHSLETTNEAFTYPHPDEDHIPEGRFNNMVL